MNRGRPAIPASDLEHARKLHASGLTWHKVAEELFVSYGGLLRALKRDESTPFESDNDFGSDTVAAASVAEGQASVAPDAEF